MKSQKKMKKDFWLNKRVLITGHTGFVGTWLTNLLITEKCKIYGISLPLKKTENNFFIKSNIKKKIKNFFFDIRNEYKLNKTINIINPHILIHLAAQSIVSSGYQDPNKTFEINTQATSSLLNCLKKKNKKIKSILVFTTDKVYKNNNKKKKFIENDALGGEDPYSASKAACEIICDSYYKSFFEKKDVSFITLRAGNIIGGGDWKKDRIFPDLIRFNFEKKKIKIRSPKSVRPWQHVLDVIRVIKIVIEYSFDKKRLSGAYNVSPNNQKNDINVNDILNLSKLKKPKIQKSNLKEKKYLSLDSTKLLKIFKIKNKFNINKSIYLTVNWYKDYYKKKDTKDLIKENLNKILKK